MGTPLVKYVTLTFILEIEPPCGGSPTPRHSYIPLGSAGNLHYLPWPLQRRLVGSGMGICFLQVLKPGLRKLVISILVWQQMKEFSELDRVHSYQHLCFLSWEPDRSKHLQKKKRSNIDGRDEQTCKAFWWHLSRWLKAYLILNQI